MQAKFGETMQKAMSHKMELHTKVPPIGLPSRVIDQLLSHSSFGIHGKHLQATLQVLFAYILRLTATPGISSLFSELPL